MTKAKYLPDEKYTEQIEQSDKNGNIYVLSRYGCHDYSSVGGAIREDGDLIDYIFNTFSGNQLKTSVDGLDNQNLVLAKNDFKDDNNSLSTEYLYDKNGNMIADANKGIALIKYNLLNLPEKIYFMNGNKIEYMYDATGVKHKAKYTTALNPLQIPLGQAVDNPSNNVLRKDSVEYSADYIYKNRKIDKILTLQGYIQTNGIYNNWDYWKYNYSLTDYQGNTRVILTSDYMLNHSTVYTASGQIDYYPFGMEITPPTGTNSGNNPYLYSGKEIDRMHGLNEYDFSARWQDAAIMGFTTMDPLAEQTPWNSPYAYCSNDPVNRVDPTGMDDHLYNNNLGGATVTGHNPNDHRQDDNDRDANNYANYWSNDHSNPNSGGPLMGDGSGNDSQSSTNESSVPVNSDKVLNKEEIVDNNSLTLTRKETTVSFHNRKIKIERYKTISLKGNLKGEVVVDNKTGKPESVKLGILSIGIDGTVTYGDAVSIGYTADGKAVLDISIPIFNTSVGTTLYFDTKQMKNDFIRSVNTVLDGFKNVNSPSIMGAGSGSYSLLPYFY